MKKLALFFLLLFFFHFTTVFADPVPGRIIVKFRPGVIKMPKGLTAAAPKAALVAAASVRALNAKHRVERLEQVYAAALAVRPDWRELENDYRLVLEASGEAQAAARDFQRDRNVEKAEPETRVKAYELTPDDIYYSQQWGLAKISASRGWSKSTGESSAIIAVIDSGLNYNHEEFSGKVDLTNAKNFVADPVSGTGDPMDDFGHGTAVSGVIGAVTNNSKGIAGIDWSAKILPIKVLDNQGNGETSVISAALAYLAAKKSVGTNIVAANMSFGQYTNNANLSARCTDAYNQGIILAAAAGNDGKSDPSYPAYYSSVLAVAAVDQNDVRSVWNASQSSNFGTWVDVSAPGTDIYSTGLPDTDNRGRDTAYHAGWDGTSLAAPHVTGLASLIKAANPVLTVSQVMNYIVTSATSIDAQNPGFEGKLGRGRIDVYKAIGSLLTRVDSPAEGSYIKGQVRIIGTAAGWDFNNYRLEAVQNNNRLTIEASTVSVESSCLGTWETGALNGQYKLHLINRSNANVTDEVVTTVFVNNTIPTAQIALPANSSVEGRVTLVGTAEDQYLNYYTLEYGAGPAPATFQTIGIFPSSVEGSVLATWETAGLSGQYTLRLTAVNLAGTATSTSVLLNILAKTPTKEIAPPINATTLTFVAPNPFDRTATAETNFVYNLAGNFDTSIYLFDLGGSLIWRNNYVAGENGGKAGDNRVPWNGKNLFGESVSPGVFLYQITADKKVLGRGKIIIF